MKYQVYWLGQAIKDIRENYDSLWKAKSDIQAFFIQEVAFHEFEEYVVAEYYFKPVALIYKIGE